MGGGGVGVAYFATDSFHEQWGAGPPAAVKKRMIDFVEIVPKAVQRCIPLAFQKKPVQN